MHYDQEIQDNITIDGYIDPSTGLEIIGGLRLWPDLYNPPIETIHLPPNPNPTITP